MNKIRVGINGLGRIGKNICRVIAADLQDNFEIVGANDLLPPAAIAEYFRRDTVHGRFPVEVGLPNDREIQLGPNHIHIFQEQEAARIPWSELEVDLIFECSRFYLTSAKASAHVQAGARKVILSAPPQDTTPIFVVGVNTDRLQPDMTIISNASCTTNCLAPLVKALDEAYDVVGGLMSATHAATSSDRLVDTIGGPGDRSVLNNIIPTTTGAARAIGKVLPHLDGLLNGTALRVPVNDGSALEAVFVVRGRQTADEINTALQAQAEKQNQASAMRSVLYVGEAYQASADAVGAPWSSMVQAANTLTIPFDEFTLVKLTAFYDNEIGYAYRMADLAILFMQV